MGVQCYELFEGIALKNHAFLLVVPVTSVEGEVGDFEAMLALSFSTLLLK